MSEPRSYLDHNASSPADARVVAAMAEVLAAHARNASSVHREGRLARDAVERARRQVASLLGATPDRIVFTSGGTEANALAVIGLARLASEGGRARLVTSRIEHPSVTGPALDVDRGLFAGAHPVETAFAPVAPDGRLLAAELDPLLRGPGAAIVSLANHELGTLQDVSAIAERARAAGMWLHCDAVQAVARIDISVDELGVDSLAISGHKMGGPPGVGALWVRPGLELPALFSGGHQERGRRPGSENVAGIVGLGVAAELAPERIRRMPAVRALADQLESRILQLDGARVHGAGCPRIGNTVNAGFAGVSGEVLVQALDIAGIAVSTGAACTSGTSRPSEVLMALGLPADQAAQAIRFSLGPGNRQSDVDKTVEALALALPRARRFS